MWQGQPRKLLLQANRNGFFYVLDRTNGKFLLGTQLREERDVGDRARRRTDVRCACRTWSRRSKASACVRRSTARRTGTRPRSTRSPNLYYVQTNDKCGIFTKMPMEWEAGKGFMGGSFAPAPETGADGCCARSTSRPGKRSWELPQTGAVNSWGGSAQHGRRRGDLRRGQRRADGGRCRERQSRSGAFRRTRSGRRRR